MLPSQFIILIVGIKIELGLQEVERVLIKKKKNCKKEVGEHKIEMLLIRRGNRCPYEHLALSTKFRPLQLKRVVASIVS